MVKNEKIEEREQKGRFGKVGTKGEVVVPVDIRKDMGLSVGSMVKFVEVKSMIIIKKIETNISKDDLKLIKKIENAIESVKEGKGKKYSKKDYVKELKSRITK